MKLICVILNYRTPGLVTIGLGALNDEIRSIAGARVVVTDNDSKDGSAEIISAEVAAHDWSWAEVRALPRNGGFGYGNNAGFQELLASEDPPEYVLLLNPDARIRPGAVHALLRYMEANPDVGIAGSQLEDDDGTPQESAFRFPSIASEIIDGTRLGLVRRLLRDRDVIYDPLGDAPVQVDWVCGAAMMIRRDVFDKIGLLDEGYFLYFDDVDFCMRANRAGVKCMHVPSSRVVHYQSASTGVGETRKQRGRRPAYWFESRRRFWLTHHGAVHTLFADLAFIVSYATWCVRRAVQRKDYTDPPKLLEDFIRHSTLARGFRL